MSVRSQQDVPRTLLSVLFIAALIATCFWITKPFLSATVWAAMIVIASWPLLLSIQVKLGGRRGLAVLVMSLLLLGILIVPLTFGISALICKAQELFANKESLAAIKIPPPPEWLNSIPMQGEKLSLKWQEYAQLAPQDLAEKIAPYSQKIIGWFLTQAGSFGMVLMHCFLTVLISAIMYANGETAAKGIRLFCRRLAGQPGEAAVILAANAVRGVAIGIVGTALIQSVLAGFGLLIAGVPGAAVLTAIILLCCVAQIGPGLIMIPVTIWLFTQDQTSWGIFMAVWSTLVCTIDNFIRPFLIKKGADLPLLLIFAGVIGGLISFGLIGLFIGPVTLAVTYTLLKEWVNPGGGSPEGVVTSE